MRSNIKRMLGLIVIHGLLSTSTTSAQEQVRRITLDEAVRLFNENNLGLRLSQASSLEASGRARQEQAFPNPIVSVTHESISDQGLSQSETYYTVAQRIDWPWRYGQRRKAGTEKAQAAAADAGADSSRILFDLKRTYVEAAAAEAVSDILDRAAAAFRMAERDGSARFAEGDISEFDVRRLRVERARYEQLWMEADLEVAGLRRRLTAMTVPTTTETQVAPVGLLEGDPPDVSEGPLMRQALSGRPELESAAAALRAARANSSVAGWGRLPSPTLTGGFKRQSDGLDGLFLGLAVPLPLWDRKGGEITAAEAQVAAAESRELLARTTIRNDVRTTAQKHAALERSAELIGDDLLAEVDDLMDVALVSYGEGELTLLELLDAARAYSEAAITKIRLSATRWVAYFDLERAVGGFGGNDAGRQDER